MEKINTAELSIIVYARIPTRLASVLNEQAKKMGLKLEDIAGQFILSGIEAERKNQEEKK